jgi:predicted permease
VGNLVLVAVCLGAGALGRRLGRLPASTPEVLNRVVIDVALPSFSLLAVPNIRLAEGGSPWELLAPAAAPWLVFGVAACSLALLGHVRRWPRPTTGALVLTAGLGNTSFVGYPMTEALFGAEGLRIAVLSDQAGSFLVVSTLGVFVASVCAPRSDRHPGPSRMRGLRALGVRLLTFPPFVAFAAALALRGVAYPAWATVVLEKLAALVVPLALVSVGFQLRVDAARLRADAGRLTAGLCVKLLLAPAAVAVAVFGVLGLRGLPAEVTLLECAMGPMVTAAVLAGEHRNDPDLATLMVGVGIPASLLVAPAWVWLARALFGG